MWWWRGRRSRAACERPDTSTQRATPGRSVRVLCARACSKQRAQRPWESASSTPAENERAREAYEALLTVTLKKPNTSEYRAFSEKIRNRTALATGALNTSSAAAAVDEVRAPTLSHMQLMRRLSIRPTSVRCDA